MKFTEALEQLVMISSDANTSYRSFSLTVNAPQSKFSSLSGEKERRQQTLFALLTRCPEEWRCAAKLAAMCYCIAEKYTCTKKNNLCKCRWGITSTTSCRLAQGSKRCTPQHRTLLKLRLLSDRISLGDRIKALGLVI